MSVNVGSRGKYGGGYGDRPAPATGLGEFVLAYEFPDSRGRVRFVKHRHATGDPPPREKAFPTYARRADGYRWVPPSWLVRSFGESARRYFASLLYRLPDLLAASRCADVWWCEGEKDADTLATRFGVVAVAHPGGAGSATPEQARRLRRTRGRVWLVADRDGAGAFDVVRRWDLLSEVGLSAARLTIVKPAVEHRKADATDHVRAGLGLEDFEPVQLDTVRAVAARAQNPQARRQDESWSWPQAGGR